MRITGVYFTVLLAACYLQHCAGLVQFSPGIRYIYRFSGDQEVIKVAQIKVAAEVSINLAKQRNGSQICHLQVNKYSVVIKNNGIDNEPNMPTLDFRNRFQFEMTTSGEVTRVFYTPTSDKMVVDLQKMLLSSLSCRLTLSQQQYKKGAAWGYKINETTHEGTHEALYKAVPSGSNIKFTKTRLTPTMTNTKEEYNKVIHYSPALKVPHRIKVDGHFSSPSQNAPGYTAKDSLGDSLSSSKHYGDNVHMDVPEMKTSANLSIELVRTEEYNEDEPPHTELKQDTLLLGELALPNIPLHKAESAIERNLTCIARALIDGVPDRGIICYQDLVSLLRRLSEEDLTNVTKRHVVHGESVASQRCMVDAVASVATNHSWTLLTDMVLKTDTPDAELILRMLAQMIDLKKQPPKALLDELEERVFQNPYAFNDSQMTDQVNERVALTFGAIVEKMKSWDYNWSIKIAKKLETLLGVHDIHHLRSKRSALSHENYNQYVHNKALYLWTLGNAAVDTSYHHVVSYVNSTDSPLLWRRGGVYAVANYKTEHAAETLLQLAITDDDEDVRRAALLEYRQHPHGADLAPFLNKDGSHHRNLTYAIHPRARRSVSNVLARIWKGFDWKLESPSVDWRKAVGGTKLGASFGVIIRNLLDILIRPLSGHVKVDVHDGAWVTVHVGILGFDWHLFKAEVCFKGQIEYELNILKEFGYENVQEYAERFAKVVKQVHDILTSTVKDFKALVDSTKELNLGNLFDQLKTAIKDLPKVVRDFPRIGKRILQTIANYADLPPVVDQIQTTIRKVRTLFKDIKSDVMGFYNAVVDMVSVTLPWAWKEIKVAFSDIVDAIKRILKNPKTAINDIGRSVTRIFAAVGGVTTAKDKIDDANLFKKENRPYWFDFEDVIKDLWSDILKIKESLKDTINWLKSSPSFDEITMKFTGMDAKSLKRRVLEEILAVIEEELDGPFQIIRKILTPFADAHSFFTKSVVDLKKAWTLVKKGYEDARTMLDLVFGPKFSKAFPRKYLESESCGDGFYESTGKGHYKHPGVDVDVAVGSRIVAPFEGLLRKSGKNQVTIKIKGMRHMVAVLDNIALDSHLDGQQVGAGEEIGTVTAPSWCSDGHVHLALIKTTSKEYIDGSSYMERREMPPPQWVQECDHYVLIWKNKVVSMGRVAGGPVQEDKTPQVQDAPDLSQLDIQILDRKKREGEGIFDKIADFAKKLGLPDLRKLKDVFNLNMNDLTLGKLMDTLDSLGLSGLRKTIYSILKKIQSLTNNKVCQRPDQMDDEELKRELVLRGENPTGARETLIRRLKRSGSSCLGIKEFLEEDLYCRFDAGCLSFSCCVDLKFFIFRHAAVLFTNYDPCSGILRIGVNEWSLEIDILGKDSGGVEGSSPLEVDVNIMKVAQLVLAYRVERRNDHIRVNLGVSWCSARTETCQPLLTLVDGAEIPLADCDRASSRTALIPTKDLPDLDAMRNMTIAQIMKLIEFSKLDGDVIDKLIDDLREGFQKWLLSQINKLIAKIFGDEFNLFELCTKGYEIKFGPYMVTFFDYTIVIPVGPIPLAFNFGAGGHYGASFSCELCIMSMKAVGRITPAVGARVWGAVGVRIWLLTAELRLTGYLLSTYFPTKVEVQFQKFPLDVKARMDLHLQPLRLTLHARLVFELKIKIGWVKIHIRKVLINVLLWSYATPMIKKNIFNLNDAEPDKTVPDFLWYGKSECVNCEDGEVPFIDQEPDNTEFVKCYNCSGNNQWQDVRRKRDLRSYIDSHRNLRTRAAGRPQCIVKQVEGRDYTDPAFNLEFGVEDDRSDVQLDYSVGTVPSADDVVSKADLGGVSTVVRKVMVSGRPLYFTVCAKNSGGLRSCTYCNLPTYDLTIPGGRVTPDFTTTSHPEILKGSALVIEDSLLTSKQMAVGYGRGIWGDQIVHWTKLAVVQDNTNVDIGHDPLGLKLLKKFSAPRHGRLQSKPVSTANFQVPEACARVCVALPTTKCLGFNYDFGLSGHCEILEEVEGHGVERHTVGSYHYYERIGIGHKTSFEFTDLNLLHNNMYYYNFYLQNTLRYKNVLSSMGVLTDFTSPEPGHIENAVRDTQTHEPCESFVPDRYKMRCIQVTPLNNYRYIVDGPGSRTIFNGHIPLIDERYTRSGKMMAANWDGIHDNETGILMYTWGIGSQPCQTDVHPHRDPHDHLSDASEWTHTGIAYPLNLKDGNYHMTVQAINKVEYGGPLALAVCHSTPYTVDTTPPVFYGITDLAYDEDLHIITFKYNATDPLSGIKRTEFGLGRSKRDTYLLAWSDATQGSPMSYTYQIPDGVPAWVKLRMTNHVELRTVGHADRALLVDTSPPFAGSVYDGEDIHHGDLEFQKTDTKICGSWKDFYDPESGILKYRVGVGSSPYLDDTVEFEFVGHSVLHKCWMASLSHKQTYYVTVTAYNNGHDELNVTATSNGVLIDTTPPAGGNVTDSANGGADIEYSSETAVASSSWDSFNDPESGVKDYILRFLRTHKGASSTEASVHQETLENDVTTFTAHHLHLYHGDRVRSSVEATNNAGGTAVLYSNGFTVDLTEPVMNELSDGPIPGTDAKYTSSTTELSATWNYTDPESGVDQYKVSVYKMEGGNKVKIYPTSPEFKRVLPTAAGLTTDETLSLELGLHYSFRVAAVNRAKLTAVHQTDGVTLDNTPPQMLYVHAGSINGETEELENGYVLHNERDGIWASWQGLDPESGINMYLVAIGTTPGGTDVLEFVDVGKITRKYLTGFTLSLTKDDTNTPLYYITVKCKNGADEESSVATSSPVKIVEGDKTGLVEDGALIGQDIDFQEDVTTITMSFHGFQSARDGIAHYLWAIGTAPLMDDVMPFVMDHISVEDESVEDEATRRYHAQNMVPLKQGLTYHVTVRAITGAGRVLETCSDGVTVDTTPPQARFTELGPEGSDRHSDVIYQRETDSITAMWNVSDSLAPVETVMANFGLYPGDTSIIHNQSFPAVGGLPNALARPADSGRSNYLSLKAWNGLGLETLLMSPAFVVDQSPPEDGNVQCPSFIAGELYMTCTWNGFSDLESGIDHFKVGFGSFPGDDSLVAFKEMPLDKQHHTFTGMDQLSLIHQKKYFVTVIAVNRVGQQSDGGTASVVVDDTPPEEGMVVELSSTASSGTNAVDKSNVCGNGKVCPEMDAICQRSTSTISVAFEPFEDSESGVTRYQISVGSSYGGNQIQDFIDVAEGHFQVTLRDLDLTRVRRAFVTVKAYNGAGLYSVATSNGVYISRISAGLPPLRQPVIYDGHIPGKDLDYQDHNDGISASWDFSGDPCPITKYEWSIHRMDGKVMLPFATLPKDQTKGEADELEMRDGETYFTLVRATNQLGHVFTRRSDGIQIQIEPLLPGSVRDGDIFGFDLAFQPSLTELSANWDGFGKESEEFQSRALPVLADLETEIGRHQVIDYYEVAAGTDRRYPVTRENIQPFINVGKNKTWTFEHLQLTPKTAVYYITVRAHSVSTATVEVVSNGIKVGMGGHIVSVGEVTVKRYIPSTTELDISWKGFRFAYPTLLYQWGLGKYTAQLKDTDCMDLEHHKETNKRVAGKLAHLFDVNELTTSVSDTFVKASGLDLKHNHSYLAAVIAVDQTGGCMMSTADFTVDTTPPVEGTLNVGHDFGKAVVFVHDASVMEIRWSGFSDPESDVTQYEVAIVEGARCTPPEASTVEGRYTRLSGQMTSYTAVDLELQTNTPYYVFLRTTNGAGLSIVTVSKTIMLDPMEPGAGTVIDGDNIMADKKFQSSLSEVKGSFLYLPTATNNACPHVTYSLDIANGDWQSIQTKGMNGRKDQNVIFKHKMVKHVKDIGTELTLKRDVTAERLQSSSIHTKAHLAKGGKYKFSLKAASGELRAVTSVCIRDGPVGEVWDYPGNNSLPQDDQNDLTGVVIPDGLLEDTGADYPYTWNQFRGFGMQIRPADSNESVSALLVWVKARNQTWSDSVELTFDPSDDWHDYKITVNENEPSALKDDGTLAVYVDGKMKVMMSGVPSLSDDAVFQVQLWNDEDYLPQITDKFNPPKTKALIKNMQMPPPVDEPCRFVTVFRGGASPVESFYAAVGSAPLMDDVAPYRQVSRPCLPCVNQCLQCDPNCKDTAVQSIRFALDGLTLPFVPDSANSTNVTIVFLSVKAVSGSGREVVASSDGVYIDVTPPEITYLVHVDTSWSSQEPSRYQGSNSSIAVIWEATDPQSEIVEYRWAIGTSPGSEDIQKFTIVSKQAFALNDKLEGSLQDNMTYYATLKVKNQAGLVTTKTSEGVTVMLTEPDESDTQTSVADSDPIDPSAGKKNPVKTKKQNELNVTWDEPKSEAVDTVYISMSSASDGKGDIFPQRRVGYNNSGFVDVNSNGLSVSGEEAKVSDVRDKTLRSRRSVEYELVRTKRDADPQFYMEPGRTIYTAVKVCTKAHKCGFMNNKEIVIIRDKDKMGTAHAGQTLTTELPLDGPNKRVVRFSLQAQEKNTSVVFGELTTTDLQQKYTSQASNTFKSFISDPSSTDDQTDRGLHGRIFTFEDVNIFITTLPYQSLTGPLTVMYPYNAGVYHEKRLKEMEPRLLVWDTEHTRWVDAGSTCPPSQRRQEYDASTQMGTVNVCGRKAYEAPTRTKRGTTGQTLSGPQQLSLAGVNTSFTNTPPRLAPGPTKFNMFEDTGLFVIKFTAEDDENDDVFFTLVSQRPLTVGGNVSVSADGRLTYRPCVHCYGVENIFIRLVEKRTDGETALSTVVQIDIEVYPVNDVPTIFIFSDKGRVNISENIVEVAIEQNGIADETSEGLTFVVGATDVDGNDRVALALESQANETLYMSSESYLLAYNRSHCLKSPTEAMRKYITETMVDLTPAFPVPCDLLDEVTSTQLSLSTRVIKYTPEPGYSGLDEIKLIAEDNNGGRSEVTAIKVYVLAGKCLNNGTCRGPTSDPDCSGTDRINGFSGYQCMCAAGFTGTYCQVDFDECSSSPCPDNYTCIDQVGSYICHCELGWPCSYKPPVSSQKLWEIIGVAVPSGVILIGLIVVIFIRYRRPAKSASSSEKPLRTDSYSSADTDTDTFSRGPALFRNDWMGHDVQFQNPLYNGGPVYHFPRHWFRDSKMPPAENIREKGDVPQPDYDIRTKLPRIELKTSSSGSGQSPKKRQQSHNGNKKSKGLPRTPWGEMPF